FTYLLVQSDYTTCKKKKMPNRSHFWGNSTYFFKILNGIFLLEIEDGILEFILIIGVLIMFFLAM
ncbi:hypothetical protein, partial [Streptococcus suis]|uniref:hypothetical protein n=1 Tax=Streptococcus suis TaxID=1307 RepID=UPI001EDD454A